MPSESTIRGVVEFAGRLEGVDARLLREGLGIARLQRLVEQAIEKDLAAWGLTARQVEIMESLYHNPEALLTPAELSDEVGLTRSAMTSALDSLEKAGHTLRRPHPSDRRMIVIALTPSGRKFIGQHLPDRYRRLDQIMGGLSPHERSVLLHVYEKVLGFFADDVAPDQPSR